MGTPLEGGAKDQGFAHVRDIGLVADQAEEPVAVGGVAIHHGTNDHVVFDDQTAVDTARRIAEDDVFAAFAFGKVACAEQVTAGDFQLGGQFFLNILRLFPQQGFGDHLGLIVKRRNKAKDRPVVFDAFTNGQHICIGCDHLVVYVDAFANSQTGLGRQGDVRADADRHDQQVTGQFGAVVQQKGADMAVFAQNFFGIRTAFDGDAFVHQRLAQQVACRLVQLTFHQVTHDVDHSHVCTACGHTSRGFQTQQTATDHDNLVVGTHGHHPFGVFQITIGNHAFQIVTWQGNDKRVRTSAEQEFIVGQHVAIGSRYRFGVTVDCNDLFTETARHAVLFVPRRIVDHDVFVCFVSRKNGGQHDAVVVAARFGIEEGYVIFAGSGVEQLFERPTTGHTGPNDDEFFSHAQNFHQGFAGVVSFAAAPVSILSE